MPVCAKRRLNLTEVSKLLRLAAKMQSSPDIPDAVKQQSRKLAYAAAHAYVMNRKVS